METIRFAFGMFQFTLIPMDNKIMKTKKAAPTTGTTHYKSSNYSQCQCIECDIFIDYFQKGLTVLAEITGSEVYYV